MNKSHSPLKFFIYFLLMLPLGLQAQNLSGIWETKFFAEGASYSLILQLHEAGNDSSYYSIKTEMGSGTIGFQDLKESGNYISFSFWEEMFFEGEIQSGNDIKGTVLYHEKKYPVTFKKTADEPEDMFESMENAPGITDPFADDHMQQPAYREKKAFNYMPLLFWGLFWLLAGVLLWLKFKSQEKYKGNKEDYVLSPDEKENLNKLFPLIRLGKRRGEKNKGLLISVDSLFIFKKRTNASLADLHTKTDREEIIQDHQVRSIKEIPADSINHIILERVSRKGWSAIRILTKEKKHHLNLPAYELLHLMNSLKAKFADKLLLNAPIRFRSWRLLITICIITLLAAIAMANNLLSFEITNTETGEISLVSGTWIVGLILAGILLIFFSIPITMAVLDHIPAKIDKPVIKKNKKDKSHGQPFRSMPVSIFLKLIGGALFFVVILLKLYSFSEEAMSDPEMEFLRNIPWFIFYGFIGLILSVSYSLAQRNPNSKRKGTKKPILYLRSFADDRETTLNERSWKSTFMGVSPPYYFLEQYELGERTWINRFAKRLIRFFYRFHPLFLLRLMFGNPKETSEQQLGNFLKRYGFFVAIGKPGEKIVTTGASRMYVTNEEWQQTVLDTMKESAFVVLQPSRTKGIWWEVEQVFNKENPEKILLSMVNYHGFQNDYETFRLRIESLFPDRPLWPRSVGNEPLISFISFNKKWEPQVHYLKNYWAISWPFRGSTANLKQTLKPFINPVNNLE